MTLAQHDDLHLGTRVRKIRPDLCKAETGIGRVSPRPRSHHTDHLSLRLDVFPTPPVTVKFGIVDGQQREYGLTVIEFGGWKIWQLGSVLNACRDCAKNAGIQRQRRRARKTPGAPGVGDAMRRR